jgi:hypothetical protein
MDDNEIARLVLENEDLYFWWRSSKRTLPVFIKENRSEIMRKTKKLRRK